MEEDKYNYYLQYFLNQKGAGISYYSGRDYVPSSQDGDGLGDIFAAVKPALFSFAKDVGKQAISAGATVLKDIMRGKKAGESAKEAFSNAGVSLIDSTLNRASSSSKSLSSKRKKRVSKKKRNSQRNIFR